MICKGKPFLAEIEDFPDTYPYEIFPRGLNLDLTHRCPYNCKGCIESKAMSFSKRSTLKKETACYLIRRFAKKGGNEILFYGGEPTFHPDFSDILLYTAQFYKKIRIVSNGHFLKETQINQALVASADISNVTLRVSLNAGTAKTHQLVHRTKTNIQDIVAGMQMLKGSQIKLEVSFLVCDQNSDEIERAYAMSNRVKASHFWIRPETELHGQGLVSLKYSSKQNILKSIFRLKHVKPNGGPFIHFDPWYVTFLESGIQPTTEKFYPGCYYCGASRLVITPPEPGMVWSCTYWRGEKKFFIADLKEVSFDSEEFEQKRIHAIKRINPATVCREVICNRDEANKAIWNRLQVKKKLSAEIERTSINIF